MLRGECGADVTLVPNLSSFRADIDFPQISISSVGWENSLAMRSRIFSRTDLFRSTDKGMRTPALSFQQDVADAVPCYR